MPPPSDAEGESRPVDHQRALLDDARFELRRAAVAAADAKAAHDALARDRSRASAPALEQAAARARSAQSEMARARGRIRTEKGALADDLVRFVESTPEEEVARLSAREPLLLLPVRLETRFTADSLLLRVYPDDIFADSFEPELTDGEIADGREFWEAAWPGETEERAAWKALVAKAGPTRAGWVAQATTPPNLASRPAGAPEAATPARRESSWTRPAEARLLPDRWHVLLQAAESERLVSGSAIVEPLALTFSPDPDDPTSPLGDDGLEVSDDVRWTVDFTRARELGMAMEIPLQANERVGFRRVLVFGVKSSLASDVSATLFQDLLDHHRHGRGVALVPQGTPTNNTSAGAAPFPPPDPDGQRSFVWERRGVTPEAGRDGARFASALGLAAQAATHLEGADGREFERGGAMARALWPTTWGYFLTELMTPVFNAEEIQAVRRFFVNHVRGRGPYAAFRIGNTPYGLLPVTSLEHWLPSRRGDSLDRSLPDALRTLRKVWMSQTAQVPHLGRTGDPDRDLMEMLGMDASACEARVRPVMGEDATWNLMGIWGWPDVWEAWLDAGQALANRVFTLLGHPEWRPRIARLNFDARAWPFRYHLVTEDAVSEKDGLSPNYVDWIRTASVPDLFNQAVPPGWDRPVSLLYRLLRHGALLEYHSAAFQLELRYDLVQAHEGAERELHGVSARAAPLNRVQQMVLPVPAVSGAVPIHTFLADPANAATIAALLPDEPVVGFRDALAAFSGASTAELERLTGETLDLASHRLDAWITALPAMRLEQMRAAVPTGVHLGAYGWVEDLAPRPQGSDLPVTLRDGRAAVRQGGSGGHVHAPSMTHAAAAAVLRNGYLSRTGAARREYAVDLSSTRVRTGRFVLDAVREGQPIGAVFGYQMERGLHDRQLDRWIAPLRARYPLVAAKTGDPEDFVDPANPDQPKDHIAARNVVDGLALRRAHQADTIPWGQFGLPAGGTDRQGIEAELARLDQTVDAVSDLLLAEAVYQIMKGSPSVAAATLDAMAQGAVRPPDPEVATQPRRGTPLTHKVVLLAGGDGQPLPAGYPAAPTPRAVIEPRIDAWLGQLFGPAAGYECVVEFGPPDAPTGTTEVSLEDLGLRPIDILLLARARAEAPTDAIRAPASELDRRILEIAHAKESLTAETPARIEYGRAAGFDPRTDRSFGDLLELARAADGVLGRSRPLSPEDLVAEDRAADAKGADHRPADALTRAGAARQQLDAARLTLTGRLAAAKAAAEGAPFDLTSFRDALRALAAIGVTGAYPLSSFGHALEQRKQLIAQGESVAAEAARRLDRATALLAEAQKPEHADDVRFLLAAARDVLDTVCGAALPFLPLFDPPAPAELSNALAHTATADFIDADPRKRRTAIREFERVAARVRPAVDAWRRLEILAGSLGRDRRPRAIVQLPYEADARWVALPFAEEEGRPKPGRTAILLYQADAPGVNVPWAGLVLDQWIEMIPLPTEQTGVAFHYDDPGAEAPQAVLVAVPPVADAERWSLAWLVSTLKETLEMARIRGIDSELLGQLGQLLPAICLADSTADVTIRSNFHDSLVRERVILDART